LAHDTHIVDLEEMAALEPLTNPLLWWASVKAVQILQFYRCGIRMRLENAPAFDEPVLFAMNHSHLYDFVPTKTELYARHGVRTSSLIKYRAFQLPLQAAYMSRTGNIAITSRGYLIAADFARVHGRKLDMDEYRVLRDHIDGGTDLPDDPRYQTLLTQARDMLGLRFDPSEVAYREMIGRCYRKAMRTTMAHARVVLDAGDSLHIYPEGLCSSRLSRGRTGTIQMAAELGTTIVPLGLSGMNRLYHPKTLFPHQGGELTLRFGEPYRLQRPELEGLTAFDPEQEQRLRPVLEEETERLMDRINALLDDDCARGDDLEGDGLKGIARFFD
jgi:1-acyl-sn-glycerol-3-phosphate acyltransferase